MQSFLAHVLLVTVSHILLVTEKLQSGTGPSQGGELPPSQPKKTKQKGETAGTRRNRAARDKITGQRGEPLPPRATQTNFNRTLELHFLRERTAPQGHGLLGAAPVSGASAGAASSTGNSAESQWGTFIPSIGSGPAAPVRGKAAGAASSATGKSTKSQYDTSRKRIAGQTRRASEGSRRRRRLSHRQRPRIALGH